MKEMTIAAILKRILRIVTEIAHHINCPLAIAKRFDYCVGPVTNKKRKEKTMLEVNITNEQKVTVTLNPVTATGKPAKLDGDPTWEVVTGNATVQPADDGMSAELISADDPGDTDFLVKADADLGEGVIEISDIIRVHVAGAQAASLGLSAGDPQPK